MRARESEEEMQKKIRFLDTDTKFTAFSSLSLSFSFSPNFPSVFSFFATMFVSPGTPSLEFWFFVLFFPLNWAVKLENFRLNLRMNSLVVPYWAQKRARVAKKRPILCNMTVWFSSGSFFKRVSVFAYNFSAHSESRRRRRRRKKKEEEPRESFLLRAQNFSLFSFVFEKS